MIEPIEGRWWLDKDGVVRPCEVLIEDLGRVAVRIEPDGEVLVVSDHRVHDDSGRTPRRAKEIQRQRRRIELFGPRSDNASLPHASAVVLHKDQQDRAIADFLAYTSYHDPEGVLDEKDRR